MVEVVLVFLFHSSYMEWISCIHEDTFVCTLIFGCFCWTRLRLGLRVVYADFGGKLTIGLGFGFDREEEDDAKRMSIALNLAVCRGIMVWLVLVKSSFMFLVMSLPFIFVFVLM